GRVAGGVGGREGADLTEDAGGGRCELLRSVEALSGGARLRIEIDLRGGAQVAARGDGLSLRSPSHSNLDLQLSSSFPLEGLRSMMELKESARLHLTLRCGCASSTSR